MECIFCCSKPCVCKFYGSKHEIKNIFASENLNGVRLNSEEKPNFSAGKGGRYWFDDTAGLISPRLLKGLILHIKEQTGKELKITQLSIEEARKIYNNRDNGYCIMDEVINLPKLESDKMSLCGELCVDELEAIYNMCITYCKPFQSYII